MAIKSFNATVSAANTNRDGTGTLVNVVTGAANGSRVEQIFVKATAATTAGTVRFFLFNGTDNNLIHEVPVEAVSPTAFIPSWGASIRLPNLLLSPTHILKASTHNAETFRITATVTEF